LDLVGRTEPDIALVDTDLPDGSGIDLTRELLERRPALGVILYTGDSDVDKLYSGLDSGARGYALKGGSVTELVGAIERVAAGGSYVDGRLEQILLSPRATPQVSQLSPREREIMRLMAERLTGGPIAKRHNVWVKTVRDVIRKLLGRKP
jgi:DNA-binding NarL/FixJ family response regulator